MISPRDLFRDVVVNTAAASLLTPRHLRWLLLRAYGIRVARAYVGGMCWFGESDIEIGESSYVNRGVFFDGSGRITVGRRVHIGMQAMIVTGTHDLGGPDCRAGALRAAPVVIGDGCWIGARALIMPGVEIGEGTVIAAGSVVTTSCLPNSVYAGAPAKRVRDLDDLAAGRASLEAEDVRADRLEDGEGAERDRGFS